MDLKNFKLSFPLKKVYTSKYYPLIIIDSDNVIHYWNFDGSYDGFSCDPCIDFKTRINKN